MTGIRDAYILAASAAAAAMVFAQPAFAQQRPGGNACAVYGSDFVAVQGTGSCVRIGGRVRLDMGAGNVGHSYAPGPAATGAMTPFASGPPGEGLNRAHMRLGAPGSRR